MLRKIFFGLAVMGLAATSQAATISWDATPTPNMDGFTTYKLTATTDPGTKIIGFDFVGNNLAQGETGAYGFWGPMNQVVLFGGAVSTIWADNNPVIDGQTGLNRDMDSQFSVTAASGLAVNASESASSLRGAYNATGAALANATNVLQFAQLTIADAAAASVEFDGNITVRPTDGADRLERVTGIVPGTTPEIPEPSTIALAGLALVGLLGYSRRK